MSLLIVDGYNIINNWPEFAELREENMEAARVKLVEILHDYVPLTWQKIVIVYDAYRVKGRALSVEEYRGLEVIFTAEGQTADSFIERLVTTLIKEGVAVEVASSDYMEQNIILWKGGRRISARELRERLQAIRRELLAGLHPNAGQCLLDERIPPRIKTTLEKWRRRRY
ncbi:MAG: NYN domain-containing protein [Bacillota bacterium]